MVFVSCAVLEHPAHENSKEILLPFSKKDYPDTNHSFYVISNAVGTNLNAIKSQATADAQFKLAQRAMSIIESHLELTLTNSDELSQSKSRLNSVSKSNIFANKIVLVDDKFLLKDSGKYDYWAVFSISLDDVLKVINSSVNLDLERDFYKSSIDKNFQLTVNKSKISLLDNSKTSSIAVSNIENKIIKESKKYLGVPYVWGGENPEEGFDCSGYVQWVLKESIDFYLPRTSKQQHSFFKNQKSKTITQIDSGDILFFKTIGQNVSHVAIAINKNTFIHAPNFDSSIRIDDLKGYWKDKFFEGFAVNF